MSTEPLYIDFETRSPVDLKKAGLGRYAMHPLTEALCMAFAVGDGPIHLWQPGEPFPKEEARHIKHGKLVVAHNAQFELAIWNFIMATRFGWPALDTRQVRCTMAACYAMGLPGALENAGHALGIPVQKDTEGRALMLKMCKPTGWDGDKPIYVDTPEKRQRLGDYCKVDVGVEREIYKRVLPLTDKEQRVWVLDQAINLRGVPFDMESLDAALEVADAEKERLDAEMSRVTQGAVQACSAIPALKEWAADFGVMPDSLAKAELAELLDYEDLPGAVRDALKIRQSAGRFTSISKLKAIKQREIARAVMYLFQYHAATTGRWAGRGVQPHNFTRDLPEPDVVEEVLRLLRERNARWIDLIHGEPSIMISKCLRGFIKARPGNQLMGGDFSAVEGRGVAWLAGEEWKIEAYREIDADPELPDMYERTYGMTFGIAPADVSKTQRQVGKVEDLAFGYQGGVRAFEKMASAGKLIVVPKITPEIAAKAQRMGYQAFTELQVEGFKNGWRESNPAIVNYWYSLQDAAIAALRTPGTITQAGAAGREVRFRKRGSFLWCRLPSGRTLCYPYPALIWENNRPLVTFKSVPDATIWAIYARWLLFGKPLGIVNPTYIVDEPGNTREWCRISTYGGKLAENITQAICRDLLADAMLRVEAAGFRIVLHVHDEIVVEGCFSENDRCRFENLMCEVPEWAHGFPVKAGCWLAERYRKE